MKYGEQHIPIGDLRAETLLNAMFPPDMSFHVCTKGTFYSNYCEDVLELSLSEIMGNQVSLSRDGLLHILPDGIFFHENACREARKKGDSIEPEKKQMAEFFAPFDTEFFNVSRGLELAVHETERDKITLLLDLLYKDDMVKSDNPLIQKSLPFLLYASEIRGNISFIGRMLKAISGFKTVTNIATRTVLVPTGRKCEYPCVNIEFHIPRLSHGDYSVKYNILEEFVEFIAEWFLPAEMEFEFSIKDENQMFILDEEVMILDYNTFL